MFHRGIRNNNAIKPSLPFSFLDGFLDGFLVSRGSSFKIYFIFIASGVVSCGGRKTFPRTSS